MRADDIWGDFALLPAPPPAPDGNEREVPPTTAEAAAAFFRCETLGCSMRGAVCAKNWTDAENGASNRPSCRGCAAGAARHRMLSAAPSAGPTADLPASMRGRRSKRRIPTCGRCGRRCDSDHTPMACMAAARALSADREAAALDAISRREAADRERKAENRLKREGGSHRRPAASGSALEAKRVAVSTARDAPAPDRVAAAERRGMMCASAAGCGRPATRSMVGPYCWPCIERAKHRVSARGGDPADVAAVAAVVVDPSAMAHRCHDWSAQPLGVVPDREIAAEMGVSLSTVRDARYRMRIRAQWVRRDDTIDWDAQPLGRVTDREIAEALGIDRMRVCRERKRRGIRYAPHARSHIAEREGCRDIDWSAQPWGRMADGEIARALRVSTTTVRNARLRLGHAPCTPPGQKPVDIDWDAVPLGRVSDREIARRVGCSSPTVMRERKRRGIAAAAQVGGIDWSAQPLGAVPDDDVARSVGTTVATVRWARISLGIAPCQTGGAP